MARSKKRAVEKLVDDGNEPRNSRWLSINFCSNCVAFPSSVVVKERSLSSARQSPANPNKNTDNVEITAIKVLI